MNAANLWAMLSGSRGFHELRFDGGPTCWLLFSDERRFELLAGPSTARKFVSVCPRIDMTGDFAAEANVLWARVTGTASSSALLELEPHPTVLLRDGTTTRRTALWALEKPLTADWAEKAVLRLQHRFGGAQKAVADPTWLFELPGPRVSVESFDPDALYTARQVVGGLPAPPKQYDGWKTENREAA